MKKKAQKLVQAGSTPAPTRRLKPLGMKNSPARRLHEAVVRDVRETGISLDRESLKKLAHQFLSGRTRWILEENASQTAEWAHRYELECPLIPDRSSTTR